jgi:hypothetical protein
MVFVQLIGCASGPVENGTGTTASAPAIVQQPVNQNIPMGLPATFAVSVSGSSLNYQWDKNGQCGCRYSIRHTLLSYVVPMPLFSGATGYTGGIASWEANIVIDGSGDVRGSNQTFTPSTTRGVPGIVTWENYGDDWHRCASIDADCSRCEALTCLALDRDASSSIAHLQRVT